MWKALLLDLDGTLLDLDGNAFLDAYAKAVAECMRDLVAPQDFLEALMSAAVPLLSATHPGKTNRDVLWQALSGTLTVPQNRLTARLDAFLAGDLGAIYPGGKARPGAHRLVTTARSLGLKLAVATMPIYPLVVIQERLRRGGFDRVPWDVVATDDLHAVKPHPAYFEEICRLLSVPPHNCVMVGDDYFQDVAAQKCGVDTYYVGPPMPGLHVGPSGTLDALVDRLLFRHHSQASGEP